MLSPTNAIDKDGERARWYCYGSYAMDVDRINKELKGRIEKASIEIGNFRPESKNPRERSIVFERK